MSAPWIDKPFAQTVRHATHGDAIFLNARQFLALATSRKKMLRADGPGATIRGLLDAETGKCYLIEESQLTLAY